MALKTLLAVSILGADAGGDGASPEVLKRAAERWGSRFVPVSLWLRKSEGEEPSRFSNIRYFSSRFLRGSGAVEGQYDEKRPVEVAGLAVDPRTVWIPDLGIERRFIARVEAGSPPAPAVLLGAFLRAPGWVVRPDAPLPGIDGLLAFAPAKTAEGLLTLGSAFGQGGWTLVLGNAGGEYRKLGDALWSEVPRGVLLLSKELEAVGYSPSGRVGIENAPDIWRGGELAAGPVLEFAALDRQRGLLIQRLSPWALTVRGFFRREEDVDGPGGRRFRFRGFHPEDESARNDFLATGYAVGPKRVLVNRALTREAAMRLERVVVRAGGEERPARFVGALRRFHAFLVELDGAGLAGTLDLAADARFALSAPLLTVTADHSTGRRRDLVELNRVADFERSYRGVLEPVLQRFPRPGTILLDPEDHAFKGLVIEVNRDEQGEDPRRSFRSRGAIDLRLLAPQELREILEAGEAAFDRRLVPRPAEREKEMVWLGVEFQPITRELSESHGVEIPTRGGEVGLLVLEVHPGSPAARAAVAAGDILLSIREEEEPEPWEIESRGEFGRNDPFEGGFIGEDPEEIPEEILARAGPPWRGPRNFLNLRLTRIGEGRRVELVYLRQGEEARVWVTLENAPSDFESARELKAPDLGLTLKDLTYEVRNHYRLKEGSPGVVVAKVEPGGKASVAKVLPFEILVSVNGRPVRGIEEFQRLLSEERERETGGRVLEFKLERMGKSRLVRIRD